MTDGEIIVLNDKGLSDFAALRKAITPRQHDLYFVAFDLLHLNGHDLRDMALEERPAFKLGLVATVKHLRGEEDLRHASLQVFREET
ncbi:hypothetical protein [Mesorhizobium caraganae]|uniref:hypothetical protein n=1 Tax=Mesorhizobium caraganae TaxID=483206 RepID=UPI0035E3C6D9